MVRRWTNVKSRLIQHLVSAVRRNVIRLIIGTCIMCTWCKLIDRNPAPYNTEPLLFQCCASVVAAWKSQITWLLMLYWKCNNTTLVQKHEHQISSWNWDDNNCHNFDCFKYNGNKNTFIDNTIDMIIPYSPKAQTGLTYTSFSHNIKLIHVVKSSLHY